MTSSEGVKGIDIGSGLLWMEIREREDCVVLAVRIEE